MLPRQCSNGSSNFLNFSESSISAEMVELVVGREMGSAAMVRRNTVDMMQKTMKQYSSLIDDLLIRQTVVRPVSKCHSP
jgi:hypothetical protein